MAVTKVILLPVAFLLGCSVSGIEARCLFREPPDIVAAPQQTDTGFFVDISGTPVYYEPGHLYTVSLRVRAISSPLCKSLGGKKWKKFPKKVRGN
jgi:hypothetical protein